MLKATSGARAFIIRYESPEKNVPWRCDEHRHLEGGAFASSRPKDLSWLPLR